MEVPSIPQPVSLGVVFLSVPMTPKNPLLPSPTPSPPLEKALCCPIHGYRLFLLSFLSDTPARPAGGVQGSQIMAERKNKMVGSFGETGAGLGDGVVEKRGSGSHWASGKTLEP